MVKVKFLPMDIVVDAQVGDTILETALNNGIPIQHACGGFCSCTTCHIQVQVSPEGLSKIEEDEEETLNRAEGRADNSRLGCQAKIAGPLTIKVMNIDD